jgi:hypothetical protein
MPKEAKLTYKRLPKKLERAYCAFFCCSLEQLYKYHIIKLK